MSTRRQLVQCKKCSASWMKRTDSLKAWSGWCLPCSRMSKKPHNFNDTVLRTNDSNPRKAVIVQCSDCGATWIKRHSHIKNWGGRCRSCQQKIASMTSSRIPRTKKPKPQCTDCLVEISTGSDRCRGCSVKTRSGKHHYKWLADRTLVKTTDREHQNPRYKQWKKAIHVRDGGKCVINNHECSGRLEAHHIVPWSRSPELRYEVNNGISLCHYHHPRKRKEEQRLAPVFQEMVLRPVYALAI